MLRKINVKIMVVIICSAAFSLYGVVGASGGDEPVKVQLVEHWYDLSLLIPTIIGIFNIIIVSSVTWFIFRSQKEWDKQKIEIQEKYEQKRLEEIREWEKKKYYRDLYVDKIYLNINEKISQLLSLGLEDDKINLFRREIMFYGELLKQIPDETGEIGEVISNLKKINNFSLLSMKYASMDKKSPTYKLLNNEIKPGLEEILKNII